MVCASSLFILFDRLVKQQPNKVYKHAYNNDTKKSSANKYPKASIRIIDESILDKCPRQSYTSIHL